MKTFGILFVMLLAASAGAQETIQVQTVETTGTAAASLMRADGYANNLTMREDRRVGVGTQIGGSAGGLGIVLELNIQDQDGALVGIGFGDEYNTFSLSWKHSFEGTYFTPYSSVGWSRWYNSSGKTSTSHILEGMLTADEQAEGRFGLDLLVAGGGMQYNQLEGELSGATLFGEVDLVVSPFRGKILPAAAVGAIYFF